MIPSYMIELQKLLDRYPPPELDWFKELFRIVLEKLEEIWIFVSDDEGGPAYRVQPIRSERGWDLIDLIRILPNILPNPINEIAFSKNTRHLSPTSKVKRSIPW